MYNSSGELNSREVAIVDGDNNTLQNITDLMLPGNSSCYIAGVIIIISNIVFCCTLEMLMALIYYNMSYGLHALVSL